MIDIRFSEDAMNVLDENARDQIAKYSYREEESGLYVLCGDDARFFNHADAPNCIDTADVTRAIRDIAPGEELTCDYSLFDLDLIEGRYSIGHLTEALHAGG